MKKQLKKGGFTLVEVLITASIIAILAAIVLGFTSQGVLQRSRDAQRVTDMTNIQKAFEQYYGVHGNYASCNDMDDEFQGGQRPMVGPQGDNYFCTADAIAYCACAQLETDREVNSDGINGVGGIYCLFDNSGDEEYYCVQNLL